MLLNYKPFCVDAFNKNFVFTDNKMQLMQVNNVKNTYKNDYLKLDGVIALYKWELYKNVEYSIAGCLDHEVNIL